MVLGAFGIMLVPSLVSGATFSANKKLRTAHIGVGNMGYSDLKAIASHPNVEVVALCDVDALFLASARKEHPKARIFFDYREMFSEMGDRIDASCSVYT